MRRFLQSSETSVDDTHCRVRVRKTRMKRKLVWQGACVARLDRDAANTAFRAVRLAEIHHEVPIMVERLLGFTRHIKI